MIPVIIPAYEPDERMDKLIDSLLSEGISPIVVVNDGSGSEYDKFYQAAKELGCTVLTHDVNRGKGRALKTAFEYCLKAFPDMTGVVTADSDGQHSVKDIGRVLEALKISPDKLILGCRNFEGEDIPWKSTLGNNLTRYICRSFCGIDVGDVQTGLRGIPAAFMRDCLSVKGERFEFELNMLLESKHKFPIVAIDIETIYDSKENHQTHFKPILDSIRVYRVFGAMLLKFSLSSLSSSVVDLGLFTLLCFLLKAYVPVYYVAIATVMARIVSGLVNYLINHRVVFKSGEKHGRSLLKYFVLAVSKLICSAALATLGCFLLPFMPETLVKIVVDVILFFTSFTIQRELIFKK